MPYQRSILLLTSFSLLTSALSNIDNQEKYNKFKTEFNKTNDIIIAIQKQNDIIIDKLNKK